MPQECQEALDAVNEMGITPEADTAVSSSGSGESDAGPDVVEVMMFTTTEDEDYLATFSELADRNHVVVGGTGLTEDSCYGPRKRPTATVLIFPGTRASGGIGRRARFRSVCPKGRGGSTPPSRTRSGSRSESMSVVSREMAGHI